MVLQHPMRAVTKFLRERIFSSSHKIQYFDEEISRVIHTIRDTVVNGVSNSMLIIGRRGSGKSHLLNEAIEKAKCDPNVRDNLIEIRINGLIHTDDRIALHAIAKQLQRYSSVRADLLAPVSDGEDNENEDLSPEAAELRIRGFAEQLRWLLAGLKAGDEDDSKASKALLVVLEEVDLFAAHRNQALLYNLLDVSCHSNGTPLCVIGLTCRLDVMEMLEKRVKSRFSHRQLHVIPVTAPRLTDPSMTAAIAANNAVDDDEDDDNSDGAPTGPFQRYCRLAASLLRIDDAATQKKLIAHLGATERRHLLDALAKWNSHVDEFFEDDVVRDCLRQIWEVSTCVGKLRNVIALLIAKLDPSSPTLTSEDFIAVVSRLRQDAKTSVLPSLSILELIIITVMVKLHDIHQGQVLNFEIVFKEYVRFCKTSCPGYLYEKRVVSKALDNLIQLELVVCGREAVAAIESDPAAGRRRGGSGLQGIASAANLPGQLRRFHPIACFVSAPLLTSCLDAYPGCPLELAQWAHSRTM